jgi:alpha-mannosidase
MKLTGKKKKIKMAKFKITLMLLFFSLFLTARNVYFVDGYHGGLYGHYPLEWYTRFIIDNFYKYPDWSICLEIESETWDSVKVRTPQDYRQFKQILSDERIEFTNPAYAQPYCYNISGESIIRQFQYGMRKINQHFPEVKFSTYSSEEPCFTSCLPQLLKSFGFQYAVLKCPNTCWGGYTRAYGKDLVNWVGPDTTSILAVPRYQCESFEKNSTWQTIAWNNSTFYINTCLEAGIKNPVGMCFQDAGWKNGPWLNSIKNADPNSIYVTWKEYFEKVSDGKSTDNWQFSQEDVLVSLMWGSQVLQKIAQQVRNAENKIIIAEKMGSLAYLKNNYHYKQDSIDEAWRTLMLSQHHDSWIVPYNRLQKNLTWADKIAQWTETTDKISDSVVKEAVESFQGNNKSVNDDYSIRVFNTLGFNRNEIVSILLPETLKNKKVILLDTENHVLPSSVEEGQKISFLAQVPAFGYATYKIQMGESKIKKEKKSFYSNKNECILENDKYRIVFDLQKGGTIKSLFSKNNNKEYVKKGSEFLFGEMRGFFYEENKFHSSRENPAKVTLIKDNSLETSILIQGKIASQPFKQIVTINKEQERIDFDLVINWKQNLGIGEYAQPNNWQDNRRAFYDTRYMLSVLFPVDLNSPQLYKNAPFDVCKSKLDNTFFNRWDSIKHNIILNWIDLSEVNGENSLALLTDHTTSYSYGTDFPLALTIQYSGKGLWGRDYNITQPTHVKYALVPHKFRWDKSSISKKSSSWNEPLIGVCSSDFDFENKSFIDLLSSGYELSSVQIMRDGILVRLFNSEGDGSAQKIKLCFPFKSIEEMELNGEMKNANNSIKAILGNEIQLSIPRFGVRSFYIKN